MKTRPRLLAALLSLLVSPLVQAGSSKLELPLVLQSERERLWHGPAEGVLRLSEQGVYDMLMSRPKDGRGPSGLADEKLEPVGLHIDPDPYNMFAAAPKRQDRSGVTSSRVHHKPQGPDDLVPLYRLAQDLARNSNNNVLMSAHVEKRLCPEYRIGGSYEKNTRYILKLFEKEDVEVKLIGLDTYVLLEAPGREKPFPYKSRPRAVQYEEEREAWLEKNPKYIAQGLIYQPTGETPGALPASDVRVRHAAAALAKLTGKEVFVQPAVEKVELKSLQGASSPEMTDVARIKKQLDKVYVRVVELNPQSLAVVLK